MTWNKKGTWIISKPETQVPLNFKSRLAIKVSNASELKDTWYWAGYFYQYLSIPPLGLVRVDQKINVPLREAVILTPQKFENNYQLKFNLADWISSLTLTIYEDSMPLNFEPVINIPAPVVNVPSTSSATTSSTTVPVSAVSVNLLGTNANRKKLIIANNSNQDLFVDFDSAASISDHCVKIPKISANGFIASYELEQYTGIVSGIWQATGTGAALIREMV